MPGLFLMKGDTVQPYCESSATFTRIALGGKGDDMSNTTLLNSTGNSVALTSRWIAAARAHESARPDRLFEDPFAAALASAEGLSPAGQSSLSRARTALLDTPILRAIRIFGHPYLAIRTRCFDKLLLHAVHSSAVRQVVIAAAGMDTRAGGVVNMDFCLTVCHMDSSPTGGNDGTQAGGMSLLSRDTSGEARQDRHGKTALSVPKP
jgi:hypothetical protein